ncbi:cytochrome c [Reyranella sp.]|jgi:mono/diheme cytochrome c family protein|uniref:SorB family sulfite dehydrogenase c-type cytochrome subunit n=1 Tax=Reyranella sp. TaxID=1929291 RepID=UPI002F95438E
MNRFALVGLLVAGSAAIALPVSAKPLNYDLPEETATLKPGPNLDVVQGNCGACHSSDYIQTQPRGPKFKKDFWQAEVTKMIKVYGAPIKEEDVPKIVDYLSVTY